MATIECIHCGAVEDPVHGISVEITENRHGEHAPVCNICESRRERC